MFDPVHIAFNLLESFEVECVAIVEGVVEEIGQCGAVVVELAGACTHRGVFAVGEGLGEVDAIGGGDEAVVLVWGEVQGRI